MRGIITLSFDVLPRMPQASRSMKVLHSFIILALAAVAAWAESPAPQKKALSLEQCIQVALEHNFAIQIRRLDPTISRFNLRAAYGAYDPVFTVGGEHDYSLSPGGVDDVGRTYSGTETDTDSFRSSFQGVLPWGLNYNLGGNVSDTYGTRPSSGIDRTRATIVTNSLPLDNGNSINYLSTNYAVVSGRDPFESARGTIGLLQLRQPLLKGFWIDNTRLQIYLNRRDLRISELRLRDQVHQTITAVEEAYYNLMFSQENVKVQRAALELADRLLAENRKRVEVGALAPLDEKQAEAQAASSRADLLAAEGREDTQQRVLKSLLSDDYTKWANVRIEPTLTMFAVPQHFNLQESWRNGLSMRPDLQQQRINLEKQGQVVRYQKSQLYPQLDLLGTYGYTASDTEFSGTFRQFADRDNPYWSYGAQLSMPLTRTSERNNYKASKSAKDQISLVLRQLEQTVLIQIEDAIAVVNTSFQRVSATREARVYAEAALEAEQKKLASGKSTSFEVLRLQRDLTTARSAEIRALADYNIALAQLALNEGTTLERRQVNLEVR